MESGKAGSAVILRFDEFELTLVPLALRRGGQPVRTRTQVLQLLQLLASRPGVLVTHAEIRRHLWNGRVVDFTGSVHVCVRQLREALGDNAGEPRFVETVPRQGYRFVAPVRGGEPAAVPAASAAAPRAGPIRRPLAGAGLSLLAVVALALLITRQDDRAGAEQEPARNAYLRGQYLLDRGDMESAGRSVQFFLEALAEDARHAPSHASLAKAYRLLGRPADSRRHALKAVELAPGSSDAHVQMAISLMESAWNWRAAGTHLDRALSLDPGDVEARHVAASRLAILDDFPAAHAHMKKALELDPASTLLRADYGWLLYLGGDFDAAMVRCREALDIDPRHFPSHACLERAAEVKGELAEATTSALRMMELWGADEQDRATVLRRATAEGLRAFHEWRLRFYRSYPDQSAIHPVDLADVHAALGDYEAAMSFLERAAESRTAALPFALKDPIYAPLRKDRRFAALHARLNLRAPAGSG